MTTTIAPDNNVDDTAGVTQVGPYQLTPDGDTGWFVIYLEDNEDVDSWDQLLDAIEGLADARLVSEAVLELDGQVRCVAEHWSQASVLDRNL